MSPTSAGRLKVLYLCEGFTDIRFVVGLSEIADLTMAIPTWEFRSSGLADRIALSGANVEIDEIHGRRLAFQARSFVYLLRNIRRYDVVLSQEMVRGSLNATIAGRLLGVPVVTYMGVAPLQYFRCRRERRQIGWLKAAAGSAFIRFAMMVNGRLATVALCNGSYLRDIAARTSAHAVAGSYYGVDVKLFKPVEELERQMLRRRHQLPEDRFLIFFSSRMSHEKDPETVLRATSVARERGLDAVIVNLGGGFREFLELATLLRLPRAEDWMIGRPAMHPMRDLCEYFQAADLVIQSSLEEGLGFSPLEALACGTPVVATEVGGMAAELPGLAQLTPRRDVEAMARAILWVAAHRTEAVAQAMRGCGFIRARWTRDKAFADLKTVLETAASGAGQRAPASEAAKRVGTRDKHA